MKYKLVFHTGVEADIDESYNWYEDRQTGLGERFLTELADCYQKLEIHPEYYSIASKYYRKLTLVHFPFIIAFEILKRKVFIYAVFHTGRDPVEILKRKISSESLG